MVIASSPMARGTPANVSAVSAGLPDRIASVVAMGRFYRKIGSAATRVAGRMRGATTARRSAVVPCPSAGRRRRRRRRAQQPAGRAPSASTQTAALLPLGECLLLLAEDLLHRGPLLHLSPP